jgi:hypothetical protein
MVVSDRDRDWPRARLLPKNGRHTLIKANDTGFLSLLIEEASPVSLPQTSQSKKRFDTNGHHLPSTVHVVVAVRNVASCRTRGSGRGLLPPPRFIRRLNSRKAVASTKGSIA